MITAEQGDEIKRRMAMTSPRREMARGGDNLGTPYDQYPFIGPGPYYEFTIMPHQAQSMGAASALNFFRQIGATVVQHERRSDIYTGGTAYDGRTYYYEYFLVEWRPRCEPS